MPRTIGRINVSAPRRNQVAAFAQRASGIVRTQFTVIQSFDCDFLRVRKAVPTDQPVICSITKRPNHFVAVVPRWEPPVDKQPRLLNLAPAAVLIEERRNRGFVTDDVELATARPFP